MGTLHSYKHIYFYGGALPGRMKVIEKPAVLHTNSAPENGVAGNTKPIMDGHGPLWDKKTTVGRIS